MQSREPQEYPKRVLTKIHWNIELVIVFIAVIKNYLDQE